MPAEAARPAGGAAPADAVRVRRGAAGCPAWSRVRRRPTRGSLPMSTWCSCAMRRTSGDDLVRRRWSRLSRAFGPSTTACRLAGWRGGIGARRRWPRVAVGLGGRGALRVPGGTRTRAAPIRGGRGPAGAAAARSPVRLGTRHFAGAAMMATTLSTGTVSPSLTRISASTPAAGEGISASTLSVEISNSGSSRSTCVADLLDPSDDGPFGDRFAHLRHHDVGRHRNSRDLAVRTVEARHCVTAY